MERTGALFAVAQQAAAVEPLIAAAWREGREQTRHAQEVFCTKLADDGLLPPGADLTWLIDTTTVLVAAETYLLVTRMLGWDLDSYEAWVAATLTRLLTGLGGIPALPDPELVDERSPDRVVLVVAHPAGQEVELVRGDGGNPDGQVGELAVEPGPLGGRGRGLVTEQLLDQLVAGHDPVGVAQQQPEQRPLPRPADPHLDIIEPDLERPENAKRQASAHPTPRLSVLRTRGAR
jgi:hypothetical protein